MEFEIPIEDKAKTQSFTTYVKEVSRKDAPLAGRIRTRLYDEDMNVSFAMHPLRYYQGRFFGAMTFFEGEPQALLCCRPLENKAPSGGKVAARLISVFNQKRRSGSLGKARKAVHTEAAKMLIVDGEWYYETGEPRYEVVTVGPGDNNGGTIFFVETDYDPQMAPSAYFNAKDFDSARLRALTLAEERGDDASVKFILEEGEADGLERIEVLMPEAFTCDPKTEHTDYDAFAAMIVQTLGIPIRMANVSIMTARQD